VHDAVQRLLETADQEDIASTVTVLERLTRLMGEQLRDG
jgi:hypothetical protein